MFRKFLCAACVRLIKDEEPTKICGYDAAEYKKIREVLELIYFRHPEHRQTPRSEIFLRMWARAVKHDPEHLQHARDLLRKWRTPEPGIDLDQVLEDFKLTEEQERNLF